MAIVRRLEYMLQKPPVITFKRYPTSKRLLNTNLMRTVKQHPARFGRDLLAARKNRFQRNTYL